MTLSAHQPCYLPWLGYFNKLLACDMFVVMDDVPLSGVDSENWVNRVWISGPAGDTLLTVPLRRHAALPINEVEVDGSRWVEKHRKAITQTYARAAHADELGVEQLVVPFALAASIFGSAALIAARLGIHRKFKALSLYRSPGLFGEAMLLDLCRQFNADRFLFGANGRAYVTPGRWEAAGVEPVFQDYRVPEYTRRGPAPVNQNGSRKILSVVDVVANVGWERTREMVCR